MEKSSFSFKSPKDSLGLALWQTTITWQRLIKEALEPYNISHAQHVIMAILLWLDETNEDMNQVSISLLSKLDKMTVSSSLKKLSQMGLVKRMEHAKDTRAKSVALTDNGKALAQMLVPLVETIDAKFFGILSRADNRELGRMLGLLGAK